MSRGDGMTRREADKLMVDEAKLSEEIRKLEYSAPGELGYRLANVFRAIMPLLQRYKHPVDHIE